MRHGIAAQYPINVASLKVTVIVMMNALEIFAVARKIVSLHNLRLQTLQLIAVLTLLKVMNLYAIFKHHIQIIESLVNFSSLIN